MTEFITEKTSSRPVEEQGILFWINREANKAILALIDRVNRLIGLSEGVDDATDAVDWSSNHTATVTLTANATLTFTAPDGDSALLRLLVVQTGAFTVTWPADVVWTSSAPALTASRNLVLLLYVDGVGYTGL